MKKVLLLNLPGKQKYLREYFCSKISKAKYYYPATDLVYISGWFDPKKYEVIFLDAIVESLNNEETIQYIMEKSIDIVYFIASAASFKEDKEFLEEMAKKNTKTKFIGIGDIFRELKEKSFDVFPFLDAININFSGGEIIKYIENPNGEVIDNVIYRYKDTIVVGKESFSHGEWKVPVPRWDLVKNELYNHPFAIKEYSTVMLTDFGCPFTCQFCPMSNIDHSYRNLDIVFEEIKLLKSLGIRDIFFMDQTFGMNLDRTKKLCAFLKEEEMSWSCFNRVDNMTDEKTKLMKESGCYAMIFGIETTNEEILKEYKKNTKISQMFNAFAICKKYGLRIAGTFIIGLPGEKEESIKTTIDFAKNLDIDFVSFNIATPRIGTNFRMDMIKLGWASPTQLNLESAKQKVSSWKKHEISHEKLLELQSYANRSFYLRPSYLLKRLLNLKSFYELKKSLFEGYYLLFKR